MTPVISAGKTVFRTIKKFMAFYHLPDWHKIRDRASGLPIDFVLKFKKIFE
jgi:hypothetical protein